jgi:hypothetical protein
MTLAASWPVRVIFFRQDMPLPTAGLPSKAERSADFDRL